jgi:hypothetical protein
MADFLTDEWFAAMDAALSTIGADIAPSASVRGSSGNFTVAQRVGDGDGAVVAVLEVENGAARFLRAERLPDDVSVAVLISERDAAGLNAGTLDVATALAEGRIKVRGDLSVLVAAQDLLARALHAVA